MVLSDCMYVIQQNEENSHCYLLPFFQNLLSVDLPKASSRIHIPNTVFKTPFFSYKNGIFVPITDAFSNSLKN